MMVTGHLSDGDEWYLLQEPGKMEAEEQREFLSFSSLNYRPVLCIFQRKIPLDLNQALQFLCPLGCLRKNLTTTFPNLTRQASLEDWTTTEFLIGILWLITYCCPPVRSSPVHASILSSLWDLGGVPEPDNCSFKTLFFTAEAGNSIAPWSGSPIIVPSKFIVGDLDITHNFTGIKEYIEWGFKENVPLLEEVVVLEGVGHFLHDFFQKFWFPFISFH